MIYHSAEIRWFDREESPMALIFQSIPGDSIFQTPRTDYYYLTDSDKIGIKLREGRWEVKWRVGLSEMDNIFRDSTYKVEDWIKLSTDQNEIPQLEMVGHNSTNHIDWIQIYKERQIKYIDVREYNYNKALMESSKMPFGCFVEKTRIKLSDKSYYSLAFEVFGKNIDRISIIIKAIQAIFTKDMHSILGSSSCMSYPQLLLENPIAITQSNK